ncbi:MAG TPA: LD-carboxypeptidase, partial [Feifaniaceae bacterium]|nr:LD-carboxypeptidase [Feifaniaceae bacterium]
YPKPLCPGGTVGLICPSSPVDAKKAAECVSFVRGLGFRVKAASNLTENYGGYMAGGGRLRAEWINRMFADPEVDAVFCMRGGDGGNRAAGYLDLELIKRHPKLFIGFSDATVFHLIFNQICRFVTLHGPMVSTNMLERFDGGTRAGFFEALNWIIEINCAGHGVPCAFRNPPDIPLKVLKHGAASGPLVGGNLSILCASLGTPYELDTHGKLLFIEEVNEEVRRIDRMAFQLLHAGKFRDCAGVLLGQFTGCVNKDMPSYTELDVFRDALEGCGIPVLYNVQAGHGRPNMTLPLGANCAVDTARGTIVFGEG